MNQFDQESFQTQVQAVSQGKCEKCNELVSYTIKHHTKYHPGTDCVSCMICSEKLIKLATLHLNVHTRLLPLMKSEKVEIVDCDSICESKDVVKIIETDESDFNSETQDIVKIVETGKSETKDIVKIVETYDSSFETTDIVKIVETDKSETKDIIKVLKYT